MTYIELIKKVTELAREFACDYEYVGIRFENKDRNIGESIHDVSKTNPFRDDERAFPDYGTDEYDELEELDGICAYNAASTIGWGDSNDSLMDCDVSCIFEQGHCYLLGSQTADFGEDENEIIMIDAQVLEILF